MCVPCLVVCLKGLALYDEMTGPEGGVNYSGHRNRRREELVAFVDGLGVCFVIAAAVDAGEVVLLL